MSAFRVEQVACDGGDMDLHVWEPTGRPVGSVLVLQEIFGVGPYIAAVCQRLADAGYLAAAPDVFWRFAPGFVAEHSAEGLVQALGIAGQLDAEAAVGDCVDALLHLRRISGRSKHPAVLGFCLGGSLAWGVAINDDPSACVSYYGSQVPSMIGEISSVRCPTLFHFGDDDPYIPNEAVDRVCDAIDRRPGFVVNIEHAGHAFDNHVAPMFWNESAAAAAWAKTMAFLDAHR